MLDLTGKRALVTGASRGVGYGIATTFATAGAEVIATARNVERLDQLAREIRAKGGKITTIPGDLSSRAGARTIAQASGDVDILVNNAAHLTANRQSLLVADDEAWDMEFMVNVTAPVTLMQELVPGMIARGSGSVINISTIAVQRINPTDAAYVASKAGLEQVTRALALDAGPHGVRLNVVALGMTATEIWDDMPVQGATVEQIAKLHAPIGRLTEVSEVAAMCLFLASDVATAITGAVITIDGGMMAGAYRPGGGYVREAAQKAVSG